MRTPVFDIVILADWRQAGPVFWYQHNLTEAALAAGYSLATIQVDGEDGEARFGFHPWLRRMIDERKVVWLDPSSEVDAGLSVTVDDRLAARPLNAPLRLNADLNVVIRTRYGRRDAVILDWLDTAFRGPVCLAAATDLIGAEMPVTPDRSDGFDPIWRPAVDVDAIRRYHPSRQPDETLVVGTEITSADEIDARLFGWRHRPLRLRGPTSALFENLRSWPASWHVDDVGAVSTLDFCRQLDIYLEGFEPGAGKDALASGAIMTSALGGVVVASPKLAPYLGRIATISDAPSATIDALAADDTALIRTREQSLEAVRARHDWRCHQERLTDLIGPPGRTSISLAAAASMPRRRALFFSTNGVGMGHLTRQLAIARCLPRSIEPVFLSMSQACGQVENFGFVVEYTPYHKYYDGDVDHWNAHLAHLLQEMIAFYDPAVLVFDGNHPFRALVEVRKRHPGRSFVWSRRGLWQACQDASALERAGIFDLIIEPLDLATALDRGATKAVQDEVRCIPPIRLLNDDELDDRETAAAALGLDPSKPAVLLQLGSRNNYDLAPLVDRLLPALRAVDGLQIAAMQWLISETDHGWPEDVHVLSRYPMARHFKAFDFSIATPGYNTFHELVANAIPAIFVPNENPTMDDHVARAAFAERQGFGFSLRRAEVYKTRAVVEAIGRPEIRRKMREAASRHATPNGAGTAAEAIRELVHSLKSSSSMQLELDIHRRASI